MINVVKGTHDVILDEASKYSYVETLLARVSETYGFKEFRTPIIESTNLFVRSVGESSDIVRKEMYTFLDKGERSITLRPELTAGIIRSMVNEKLFSDLDFPKKAYYVGPCFRYDRPQQGRYRQFNQFGVECVGTTSIYQDAEIIILAYRALKMLGFKDLKLKLNCLGDQESRCNYRNALKDYFTNYIDEMCEDCKERYNINPLRILDCKVEEDQKIAGNAPRIEDYLSENSRNDYLKLQEILKENDVDFILDNGLVRGLDYYSGVVFEFHYISKSGKDYGALGGGGHYSGLVNELGGPQLDGIGFAFGIERLVNVMNDDNLFDDIELEGTSLDVYVMPLREDQFNYCLKLTNYLRANGFSTDICLEKKSFSSMFKKAQRRRAKYAVLVGENEIANENVVVKNLQTTIQTTLKEENLVEFLDKNIIHEHEE